MTKSCYRDCNIFFPNYNVFLLNFAQKKFIQIQLLNGLKVIKTPFIQFFVAPHSPLEFLACDQHIQHLCAQSIILHDLCTKCMSAACVHLHQRGSFNFSTQKERLLTLITWQKRESWATFCIASCVSFGHTFRNMPLPAMLPAQSMHFAKAAFLLLLLLLYACLLRAGGCRRRGPPP